MKGFSIFDWKKGEFGFVLLAILTVFGISTVQLLTSQMKTRDTQRKADTELVSRAVEAYFDDYKILPAAKDGKIVACGDKGMVECEWGKGEVVDKDNVSYLKKLPDDPFASHASPRKYIYVTDEARRKFKIYAALENRNDTDARADLTVECGADIQCNWYVEN